MSRASSQAAAEHSPAPPGEHRTGEDWGEAPRCTRCRESPINVRDQRNIKLAAHTQTARAKGISFITQPMLGVPIQQLEMVFQARPIEPGATDAGVLAAAAASIEGQASRAKHRATSAIRSGAGRPTELIFRGSAPA